MTRGTNPIRETHHMDMLAAFSKGAACKARAYQELRSISTSHGVHFH